MFNTICSIFCFLLLASQHALANVEEIVPSTHRAGAAYLFVTKSEINDSSREPGIYARSSEGEDWKLVITGRVLPTRTSPLLMELPIEGGLTNYESLAIVDGHLMLFHIDSTFEDKSSYIVFGDSVGPIDVVTDSEFEIPQIQKTSQVKIYPLAGIQPDPSFGQIVLVSVSSDPNWDGVSPTRGVTFSFSASTSEGREKILLNSPLALDNQAYPQSRIAEFVPLQKGRPQLISHFLNRKNAKLARAEDFSGLSQWLHRLQEYLSNPSENDIGGSYYIDPVTLEEKQGAAIAVTLRELQYVKIIQDYQPQRGLQTILSGRNNSTLMTLNGSIDTFANSKEPVIADLNLSMTAALVFGHSGRLYLLPNEGTVRPSQILEYQSQIIALDAASFVGSPEGVEYVLLSMKLENGESTVLLKYQHNGTSPMLLFAKTLVNKYYPADEIKKRVIRDRTDDSSDSEYFFNTDADLFEDELADNPQAPAIAIQRTTNALVSMVVRRPLRKLEFFDNDLSTKNYIYKEYSPITGTSDDKDGVYERAGGTSGERQVARGKIVLPHASSSPDEVLWSRATFEHKIDKKVLKYQTGIYVVKTSDNRMQLGIALRSLDNDSPPTFAATTRIDPAYKIDDIMLIPNVKKNDTISMLIRVTYGTQTTVILRGYKFRDLNGKLSIENAVEHQLYQKQDDHSTLSDLIFYDENKTPFLVSNLGEAENRQQVINVYTGRALSRGNLKLRPIDEVMIEEADKESTLSSYKMAPAEDWVIKTYHFNDGIGLPIRPALEAITKKSPAPFGFKSFLALDNLMNEVTAPNGPNRHVILVIPDDLKPVIQKMLVHTLVDGRQKKAWSLSNNAIVVSYFGNFASLKGDSNKLENLSQDELAKYLDLASEARGKKPIMLVDADKLAAVGRPSPEDIENAVQIPQYMNLSGEEGVDPGNIFAEQDRPVDRIYPHALYWLATEGRADISVQKLSDPNAQKRMSAIVVASESEWKRIKKDAKSEVEYGIEDHFDVITLGAPTREEQIRLVKGLLEAPDVAALHIEPDLSGIRKGEFDKEEALEIALTYFVAKLDALTKEKGQHPLVGFSEALSRLTQILRYDREFLAERKIGRKIFEKVFTQVFSLPLNPRLLPPNDPLKILMQPNIATQIQNVGGYAGSFDLINQVVKTLKTQTQPQTTKALPGSVVLFGPTGTGKTSLFLAFVKTLGLNLYDWKEEPTSPKNRRANAMIVSCSKITDSEVAGNGLISVEEVLAKLEHLLAQPEGYRSWILFDDLHAAPDAVRAKIVSWIRMTMDSEGGVKLVQSKYDGKDPKTIPVRNLGLWMSLNPPDDNEKIKKYANKQNNPTPEELSLAALSGTDVQVDSSFFARWGLFLDMAQFPTDAKAPSLIAKLAGPLRSTFEKGVLVTVSMDMIEQIVDNFKDRHARDFLAGGVNGIIDVAEDTAGLDAADTNHSALIVVSNSTVDRSEVTTEDGKQGAGNEQDISDWIRANTVAVSVDRTIEGKLQLLNNMVNRFRSDLYMAMTVALQSDERIASPSHRHAFLAQAEQAFLDHIDQNPRLPLTALNLSPHELGIGRGPAANNFNNILKNLTLPKDRLKYFPPFFYNRGDTTGGLDRLLGVDHKPIDDAQAQLLRTFAKNNSTTFMNLVYTLLRTNDVEHVSEDIISKWFEVLKTEQPETVVPGEQKPTYSATAVALIQQMLELNLQINSEPAILGGESFNFYQLTRLFLLSVDRAISQMPWDHSANFVARMMTLSTQSLDLAESPEVHKILFGYQSLIIPGNMEQARQHLESSAVRKLLKPELRNRLDSGFAECADRLSKGPK